MRFVPDSSKGVSEIFVPLARHFRQGFRVLYRGRDLPFPPQPSDTPQAKGFRWDGGRSRLLVDDWGPATEETVLQIVPGNF